jgi:Tfp pilus assembly protein PilX
MEPRRGERSRGERGVALVMALLVLLVMALLAAVLMMSVSINRKIAGHDLRMSKALNTAEAGVGEAMSRIRSGDLPMSAANPRSVGQIYLCPAGSVPVLGTDSIAVETRQPTGAWLPYSTASRSTEVLTVQFKTNAARTLVYKYDNTLTPPIQTISGLPIYVVNATARQGSAVKRIVTEVIQKPVNADSKAAVAANHDIRFIGNSAVCGYDHSISTPVWYGENGRYGANTCVPYENGPNDLPGSWTTDTTWGGGSPTQDGYPQANVSHQTGFYSGPWDALGLSQADFYAWVGVHQTSVPANLNAITYLDNDGVAQNGSGAWGIQGQAGEGLLYLDGDLTINSWFTYKGLVYVEGDVTFNGQAWILGGLIIRGRADVKLTGGCTILYSHEAILLALAKYGGQFVTLSWREKASP